MHENDERNVHPMMYGNQPMQQPHVNLPMVQGMSNQMNPQMVQGMPNQMYPTGVQGAYQQPMHSNVKHDCRKYMNYHVQARMQDGTGMEGIITDMDDQSVEMLVPEEVDEEEVNDNRQQFGYGGGYGRRRFRRFRRRRFPFVTFVIVQPYPYYYPYSPYGY